MFQTWEQLFIDGFERMQQRGVLRNDAEPTRLATAVIAALQGGYLLAQTAHSVEPMRDALDMALDYVRSFQASPAGAAPKKRRVAQKPTN